MHNINSKLNLKKYSFKLLIPLTLIMLIQATCNPTSKKTGATNVKQMDIKEGKWAKAIFAGGCFWCMEQPFDQIKGVKATTVGYSGGSEEGPSYKQVAYGKTGHTESILIEYNPKIVSYEKLVETFWHNINPTQKDGQFNDIGKHYRTAIFYLNEEQKKIALLSKETLSKSKKFNAPIAVLIEPAGKFWVAEDYHQDYYKKEPDHYNNYKVGSGRAGYIKKTWK